MQTNKPLANIAEKLTQFFIQIIQKLDPEAYTAIKPYQGSTLRLNIQDLEVSLVFQIIDNGITVTTQINEDEIPTATLTGNFLNLLAITFKQETDISLFKQHDITITGDTSFLNTFNQTFKNIDIDWEEHLSYFIGDFTAHNISSAVKTGLNWAKSTKDNRVRDLSRFLQEEIKLLPTQDEVEYLYQDINDIKIRVEKLEKRLQRLEQG